MSLDLYAETLSPPLGDLENQHLSTMSSDTFDPEQRKSMGTPLSYATPPLVASEITAMTTTAASAAVLTTLFSGTAAQLLGVIRSDDAVKDMKGPAVDLLIFASYAAIICNVIATGASVLLTYRLGTIPLNDARKGDRRISGGAVMTPVSTFRLLREFGAGRNLKLIFMQLVAHLCLGMLFIFTQVLTYVGLREGRALGIVFCAATGSGVVLLTVTSCL
ncbi:hypothetical protein DFH09DRAFT_1374318 [Mycena vulgaris]|nr:hypothetical protein DFH09DRAFT_1374318 [Mycena vulgaris]